jgi:hypothetical protein
LRKCSYVFGRRRQVKSAILGTQTGIQRVKVINIALGQLLRHTGFRGLELLIKSFQFACCADSLALSHHNQQCKGQQVKLEPGNTVSVPVQRSKAITCKAGKLLRALSNVGVTALEVHSVTLLAEDSVEVFHAI